MTDVTIIVPVYNVEKYLSKCIDSLLNQTQKDIKILLIDDGSTDKSPEICDEYENHDNRIFVVHKTNGGVSEARNTGISLVNTKYLMFVDSDDYIEPETVELALNQINKTKSDMVLFDYCQVYENGQKHLVVSTNRSGVTTLRNDPGIMLTASILCNKIFKTSLFNNVIFPKDKWYEDLRVIIKLYTKCQYISFLKTKPLYNYCIHNNSIMRNSNSEKTADQRIEAITDVISFFKENNLYDIYEPEMEWIQIYHGFMLPSREIVGYQKINWASLQKLRSFLLSNISKEKIISNKYYLELSKIQKISVILPLNNHFRGLLIMVKANNILKKIRALFGYVRKV